MANINFDKELEDRSLLAMSVLKADSSIISSIVDQEGYDPENLDLTITVNGVEVRAETFKVFLKTLFKDMEDNVIAPEEERIKLAAKRLMKDEFYDLMNSLDNAVDNIDVLFK